MPNPAVISIQQPLQELSLEQPAQSLEIRLNAPGPPGLTPYIGENGNWWIGAVDTGTAAGMSLSAADPQPLGTAVPGTSGQASDSGHVHPKPSAADIGADPAGTAAGAVAAHESNHPAPTSRDTRNEAAGTAAGLLAGHTYDHPAPTTRDARNEAAGTAAGLLSGHTSDHPAPTTRDARNEAAGTAAGLLSGHTTDHPAPTSRDTRNEAADAAIQSHITGPGAPHTAAGVGADPVGAAAGAVSAHEGGFAHGDIAANSAARHTQGTDQGLDTGGPNAVTAAQAKGAHEHAGIASGNPHGTTASDVGAVPTTQKGAANGVAPLGADAKIASTYLPAIAIVDVFAVADEAEQLTLVAQQGDVAVRADQSKTYIRNGGIAGTMDDWTLLKTPADAVLSVAGQTGVISKTDLLAALSVEDGAQKNVQSDWNAATGDAFILNKPTLGTAAALDVPATGDAADGQAVKGDDTRLDDARTPTAHAASHATGQADEIEPSDIGAEPAQTAATDDEITAGAETDTRKVSPAQLKLAAETHGGGGGDIDGGSPSSIYGGTTGIDGGTP